MALLACITLRHGFPVAEWESVLHRPPNSTGIPPLTAVELRGGGHPGPEMTNLKAECHSSHGPAGEGRELLRRYGADGAAAQRETSISAIQRNPPH